MNRQISLTLALAPLLVAGWTQAAMSVGGGAPRMDSSAPLIQIYQEPGAAPRISSTPDGGSAQAGWPDAGRMAPPSGTPFASGPGPGSYSAASSLPPPGGGYVGAPMTESSPGPSFSPSASRPNPPADWMMSGSPGQGGAFPGSTWMGGGAPGGYAAPGQSGPGGGAYPGSGGGLPPPGGIYPGGTASRFASPWGAGAFPGGLPASSAPGTEFGGAGSGPRSYPELSGNPPFSMGANEPSLMPSPDRGGSGGYNPAGSGWGPGGLAGPGPGGTPRWGPWSSMMADPLMMMLERHLDFMDRLDRIETKLQEILERLPKSPTP